MGTLFQAAATAVTSGSFWQSFGQIVGIDAILSIDNLAVIFAVVAASTIRDEKTRRLAMTLGVAAAIGIRLVLAGFYGFIGSLGPLAVGGMFVAGAWYLFKKARELGHEALDSYRTFPKEVKKEVTHANGLAGAVAAIMAIDFVASLDNVLVAGMYATQYGAMFDFGTVSVGLVKLGSMAFTVAPVAFTMPVLLPLGILISGLMLWSGLKVVSKITSHYKNHSDAFKRSSMVGLYATAGLLLGKVALEMICHGASLVTNSHFASTLVTTYAPVLLPALHVAAHALEIAAATLGGVMSLYLTGGAIMLGVTLALFAYNAFKNKAPAAVRAPRVPARAWAPVRQPARAIAAAA